MRWFQIHALQKLLVVSPNGFYSHCFCCVSGSIRLVFILIFQPSVHTWLCTEVASTLSEGVAMHVATAANVQYLSWRQGKPGSADPRPTFHGRCQRRCMLLAFGALLSYARQCRPRPRRRVVANVQLPPLFSSRPHPRRALKRPDRT